jgi:hypothetical protein
MDFGKALNRLKGGSKVARAGWNGKGMWLVLQKGYPDGIPINRNTAEATEIPEGTVCKFRPYIMMYTADAEFVPWVASQTDLLADDWQWVSDANQCAPAPGEPTPGAAYGAEQDQPPISIDDLEPPFVTGKFEGPAGDQVHAEITVTRQQGHCKGE